MAELPSKFDDLINTNELPVLVDFYADWCGPCKMVAPILEELAQEYAGEIYIYKVDTEVDANGLKTLCEQYKKYFKEVTGDSHEVAPVGDIVIFERNSHAGRFKCSPPGIT